MKHPNIILITMDALRYDHLGFMGYEKDVSPFLDSLSKKGSWFRYMFSNGAGSLQAFIAMMTSTYPLDYGGYAQVTEKRTLLSEALQRGGYATMGFHSNPYFSSYFGYGRGWNIFRYLNYFSAKGGKENDVRPSLRSDTWQARLAKILFDWPNRVSKYPLLVSFFTFFESFVGTSRKMYLDLVRPIPPYYTAFEMNEAVKAELRKKPRQPLFLWVHYMDLHNPYGLFLRRGKKIIPKIKSYFYDYFFTFFSEYSKINRMFTKTYVQLYDEGIRNTDNAIRELFGYLSSIGVLDDKTAIFITGDHGEEFEEHGNFLHTQKAFNENIRVPFIGIVPQKFSRPESKDAPRGLIDLAPTILDVAGVPRPKNFRGKNIFDEKKRDVIIELSSQESDVSGIHFLGRAIVAEGHKLIKSKAGNFLFSLNDEKENDNLFEKNRGIAARLESRLKKFKNFR